ncbi:hypothetical protein LWP59_16175 [Amycolatopsis acidiphila]|uniref:Uncharacterized protein n=1 Tax=Amycolatopsis acidiphila TaxID=715473 RepID=A0A557ZNF7_9PSEU|nr:hypothetical protein [Amycolatopsis acidiphila]TVT13452.1 hypothetical protein FNH06_39060 [Amycolatopsis acidiphila]UIJ63053.1 hypothetical protein LWP59_16175 [Amycolatopsis acidiphila]
MPTALGTACFGGGPAFFVLVAVVGLLVFGLPATGGVVFGGALLLEGGTGCVVVVTGDGAEVPNASLSPESGAAPWWKASSPPAASRAPVATAAAILSLMKTESS